MRELNDTRTLSAALRDARDYTLALYSHLTPGQMQLPYLRSVNPPLWEMAHVGWFQEFWCLRYQPGKDPLPTRWSNCDPMLNSAIIPHAERWQLPQLTYDAVHAFLQRGFEDTLEALEHSNEERHYFFQLALFHEDMHAEAMLMTLQTLGYPAPARLCPVRNHLVRPLSTPASDVHFEGGEFEMGSRPGADFVFDNEKWAHAINLAPFALSSRTVTVEEYLAFVAAGGYLQREWWTEEGWEWKTRTGATAPRYWKNDSGPWLERRFNHWGPLEPALPMMHVNAYEAQAYCCSVGRRLPSEAEWEFAARARRAADKDRFPWGGEPAVPGAVNLDGTYGARVPANALASADTPSGLRQMLGNAWEWTSTPFEPYPAFAPDAYQEYSQPWFGDHRVLRGGCFATRSRLVHNRWRNFYTPDRNDIFAGFRTAAGP